MITNVSPKALLFSLLASPKLEILYLEYISWTENEDISEVINDVTASMPYLQRIAISEHIDDESLMVLNSIFSHISTPPDLDWLSQIFIYDTIDSYVEDEFYIKWIKVPCHCQNLIVDLTPSILGLTLLCGRTRKIPWDLVDDDYTSPNTCKKEVVLTPEGDGLFDAILYLQKIGHVIRSSHLLSVQSITLRFAGTVGDITDEDWLPILSSLPSVRFLSVMKNGFFQKDKILDQNAANVVRALGWNDVPITTEESNMMICPKLECLTLEIGSEFSKYLYDSLEYGLRMRKQLGFGLKTLKLIIESINETDFTAISNVVEEILEFDCKPTR